MKCKYCDDDFVAQDDDGHSIEWGYCASCGEDLTHCLCCEAVFLGEKGYCPKCD